LFNDAPERLPASDAPVSIGGHACDVLVVGGGINGTGIARDLAGRGLDVLLCEKDDLAQHTSSSSTKLIHGGLRYLEHYEFGLVRKALAEREVLLQDAPHIMWPLRFVMPHDPSMRPVWMIRAGLFLYDHLAHREVLPGSHGVDLRAHPAGAALRPEFTRGFVYSDGWVDDARLVVLAAVDAAERGATVVTGCRVTRAERGAARWRATLRSRRPKRPDTANQAIDASSSRKIAVCRVFTAAMASGGALKAIRMAGQPRSSIGPCCSVMVPFGGSTPMTVPTPVAVFASGA